VGKEEAFRRCGGECGVGMKWGQGGVAEGSKSAQRRIGFQPVGVKFQTYLLAGWAGSGNGWGIKEMKLSYPQTDMCSKAVRVRGGEHQTEHPQSGVIDVDEKKARQQGKRLWVPAMAT